MDFLVLLVGFHCENVNGPPAVRVFFLTRDWLCVTHQHMKPLVLLVFAVLSLSIFGCSKERNHNGRFTIHQVEFEEVLPNSIAKSHGFVRIDTETGKTWLYKSVMMTNSISEGWMFINEPSNTFTAY